MEAAPTVSVVVASHARHLRLRWLLNAMEEQTLPAEHWELVVVHDYEPSVAAQILESHRLFARGQLRHLAIPPASGSPARQRNLGWRTGTGGLIAFTDDDCRPEPDWLRTLVQSAEAHPGAIVQGATRPDPLEAAILAAPHVRTLMIDPVGPYAQTCNILYPRHLLEQLGGFDERAITGEDVDLSLRARRAGTAILAAPHAVVNHAVESHSLPGILRQNLKWRHLAYLVGRHPELREIMPLRVFWDAEHLRVSLALLAVAAGARSRPLLALSVPYLVRAARRRGTGRRKTCVAIAEIPGQAVRQFAEVAGLAIGSVQHRTLVL